MSIDQTPDSADRPGSIVDIPGPGRGVLLKHDSSHEYGDKYLCLVLGGSVAERIDWMVGVTSDRFAVGDRVKWVDDDEGSYTEQVGKLGVITRDDEDVLPFLIKLDDVELEPFAKPQWLVHERYALWLADQEPAAETRELVDPAARIAELEAALASQQAASEAEMTRFKRRVALVAMHKAAEHDWCSVVRDVLGEVGIDIPDPTATVEVLVKYTITLRGTSEDGAESLRKEGTDYVQPSLYIDDDGALVGDQDFRVMEVHSISVHSIESIELDTEED